ncbi:MAG TPA: hypothetical protein CFH81_08735 [Sulfurovum sp. UBA12169]|nr:MAG TPA: hypothetical protein CFH81_08735 [Sulfurovum sp. UBA12169]
MMQSKKHSHFEVIANSALGIVIGWCLVYFAFPYIGIKTTVSQASASSVIFFVASYVRSYYVRRTFVWMYARGRLR